MDELLFEKFKENEERVKKYGPHVSGLVNACCNAALYPFFQFSVQLQLSPSCPKNYTGTDFQSKISSFVFSPNSANKPFTPPRFHNYFSVFLSNSIQGPLSFYRGFTPAVSLFYLNILSRSLFTSSFSTQLKDLTFHQKLAAGTL